MDLIVDILLGILLMVLGASMIARRSEVVRSVEDWHARWASGLSEGDVLVQHLLTFLGGILFFVIGVLLILQVIHIPYD
jgi:UPF0716 family protein affecting phage T7 exclusion